MTLSRDAQTGLITGSTLGSVSDTLAYNNLGEVTGYTASVGGGSLFSETYTRDALGQITAKTETIGGIASTYGYGYDPAGRLRDVTTNGTPSAHYEYDANGNRVSDANNDGITTFNHMGTLLDALHDDQDRLLSTDHGPLSTSYSYTANGELLAKTDTNTSTTYTYDVLGNLTHVTLPTGDVIDYVTDGQNRRVGKAVNGALLQGWLYDGQLRVVAELDGAGNVVSRVVYGSKGNVPDYVVQGGVTYRVISDHLGSPRLVVNASNGTAVQRTDYDEFGNVLLDQVAPGFQRVPFGFAGGLYDSDTGLTRFGARDYDPQTGRWTAKDPIGFAGRAGNLYSYAFDDPVNYRDPTGLSTYMEQATQMGISGALGGIQNTLSTLLAGKRDAGSILTAGGIGFFGGVASVVNVARLPGIEHVMLAAVQGGSIGFWSNVATQWQTCADCDVQWTPALGSALAGVFGGPFSGLGTTRGVAFGSALTTVTSLVFDAAGFVDQTMH
jgi:RHS repeat-associated protein